MNVIEMQGVSKRYGKLEALRGVSLEVGAGEVVAFLGPNGAGKTTAISIMLGQKLPDSGTVRLFGHRPDLPEARGRVGVMLQESGLPQSLTVEEIVELFARYYPYRLPTQEVLERADLLEKRRAQVSQLSGGQKQRLYFALAVVGDPDLIFLDEPTVAMDVEARRAFWEQVRGFAALGKTILFSTHYLEEADANADRVVVLHQGRVLHSGTPAQVKRRVAAKTVRLRTDAPLERLQALPGAQRLEQENGHVLVYSNEPEAFLGELVRRGYSMSDLTVKDTDLEAAFVSLTGRLEA
ncbi:Daunorubicin/doxorubicin resistance ATP-binding protein DrrA [Calidithermus terrae]|uniref:Daunorubicin/doxorubicin resistance ATP-binding protein DrrA n=1 Tax=Calidithermus terrae TaxID=1408545 RepID=A0A399EGS3_9DEIN|nr:ABC transporter ATP-binding protein [Calidithermus terrae]RIH83148.1 Daunorubicin/doxorubicin resistance ATP-binding protein DrrA [Calidithermus terrae]